MATTQLSLLDPDKFGLLIQCMQRMDRLNPSQLHGYGVSVLKLLSTTQLKNLLFIGLNAIKEDIEYHVLSEMKQTLHKIIEAMDKKRKSKPKPEKNKTLALLKNVPLTKCIPSDIISNHICTYLKMSSITNLAQCDRVLATICHTPTSISNLMHRYDPYKYIPHSIYAEGLIDGDYHNMQQWNVSNMHRFSNVGKLSLSMQYFDLHPSIFNNIFRNVEQLTFYDEFQYASPSSIPYSDINLPFKSITFVNGEQTPVFCNILKRIKNNSLLRSISFVDCHFFPVEEWDADDVEYKHIDDVIQSLILPQQPNALEVLKFEYSFLWNTQNTDLEGNEFINMDKIISSLSSLKGFVFGEHHCDDAEVPAHNNDLFSLLSQSILQNLSSFNKLESLHTHCLDGPQSLSVYLNANNSSALQEITELCISIPFKQDTSSPLRLLYNASFLPKLEKLCLVIHVSENDKKYTSELEEQITSILRSKTTLKVFQIVAVLNAPKDESEDNDQTHKFCVRRLDVLTELITKLKQALSIIRKHQIMTCSLEQPLLFRLHIKSYHHTDTNCSIGLKKGTFADAMQSFLLNYLMTYPSGKIQVKWSWNAWGHYSLADRLKHEIKRLSEIVRVATKEGGNDLISENKHLHYDMDYNQYAISADKKSVCDPIDTKWKVDCRFCCNTPWI